MRKLIPMAFVAAALLSVLVAIAPGCGGGYGGGGSSGGGGVYATPAPMPSAMH